MFQKKLNTCGAGSVFFSVMLGSLIVASCTGGGIQPGATDTTTPGGQHNPGDPLTVSGRLGSGFEVATGKGKLAGRSISTAISHIASFPVVAGSVGGVTQTSPVAADGSFIVTVAPAQDTSYLFLLVNEQATSLAEKAAGFISLQSSTGSDMVLLPLFSANRDLEMGSLRADGGSAVAETSLESQGASFSLSFDQLLETAYHDNLFKDVKNRYVNKDTRTGQIYYVLTRHYHTGVIPDAVGSWYPVASWNHTPGFDMRIDAIRPSDHTYADIASGAAELQVIPPMTFSLRNPYQPILVSPDSPLRITSANYSSQTSGFSFWEESDRNPGDYVLDFSGNEDLVNGTWMLNLVKGGSVIGKALFDLQAASPFTPAPENAFMYYMPSPRITADSDGRITLIEVQWHAWNPAVKAYQAVNDLSTFRRLTEGYVFKISTTTPAVDETVPDATSFVPAKTWYVGQPTSTGGRGIDWITVQYVIAGVLYYFFLYPNL